MSRKLSSPWLTLVLLVLLLLVSLLPPLCSALMLSLMLEEADEEGVGATALMQVRQPQPPVRWMALWQDLGRAGMLKLRKDILK